MLKTKTKLLVLENVTKSYLMGESDVKALDNVSLVIEQGEFAAITGPSGSGKSTLMHIVGLLDNPTSGRVYIEDQDVSRLSERNLAKIRNKKIGFVFQQFNLLSKTSAVENVALPLVYAGCSRVEMFERAKSALESVGLGNRLDHHPNQLSGGQQQRVAIARALVTDPAIILADEPTGNLATSQGEEIMKIFHDLQSQGKTIVLVTHEPNIARQAKRQIFIKDGKVVDKL